MTDYKIEADQNLTLALEHTAGYGHLSTADLIALAQANATLALAEQQRIANLIAVATWNDEAIRRGDARRTGDRFVNLVDQRAKVDRMFAQVREGLGL